MIRISSLRILRLFYVNKLRRIHVGFIIDIIYRWAKACWTTSSYNSSNNHLKVLLIFSICRIFLPKKPNCRKFLGFFFCLISIDRWITRYRNDLLWVKEWSCYCIQPIDQLCVGWCGLLQSCLHNFCEWSKKEVS